MKKVLICDDDENIREILEMIISMDFEVEMIMAEDGLDGIEKLKANPDISLIICDKNMPKANGVEVYKHNRSNGNIPYILLSGDGVDAITGFEGFEDDSQNVCVSKPWEEDELIQAIAPFINSDAA